MPILTRIAALLLCLAAMPLWAQGTAFAPITPYPGETVLVPLAFDRGTRPDPTATVREPGHFTAQWRPQDAPPEERVGGWRQQQVLGSLENLRRDNPDAQVPLLMRALRVRALNLQIQACTVPPHAEPLEVAPVAGGLATQAVYIGCPRALAGDYAHEMVVVTVLGETHAYTLEWHERRPAVPALSDTTAPVWQERAGFLSQAALCRPGARNPPCP